MYDYPLLTGKTEISVPVTNSSTPEGGKSDYHGTILSLEE